MAGVTTGQSGVVSRFLVLSFVTLDTGGLELPALLETALTAGSYNHYNILVAAMTPRHAGRGEPSGRRDRAPRSTAPVSGWQRIVA